jgi:drug/metabolite transporter (DMT)-like permease
VGLSDAGRKGGNPSNRRRDVAQRSYYAQIRALDHAKVSVVPPFNHTLLAWASLLGWFVFADVPGLWTILGTCRVVLSGLYAWIQDREGH